MIVAFVYINIFHLVGFNVTLCALHQQLPHGDHHVRVYHSRGKAIARKHLSLFRCAVKSHTNHGRNAEYYAWVQNHLKEHPADRVVGFNKMPGLDVYFAADVCYAEKVAQEKGFLYRLTSRYRHYAAFERATFRAGVNRRNL